MLISILPTGKLEWHALGASLQKLFPGHTFENAIKEADLDGGRVNSVTSSDITQIKWDQKNKYDDEPQLNGLERLIGIAVGRALGDSKKAREDSKKAREDSKKAREDSKKALRDSKIGLPPADLVLIVDDVELVNRDQVPEIVAAIRRAAQSHLARLQGSRRRAEEALKDRVSFHLAKPMIEAWFFASQSSLDAARIRPGFVPKLASPEVESFRTTDEAYDLEDGKDCTRWNQLSRKPKLAWPKEKRHLHPKGYLSWLCKDEHERNCSSYDEVEVGKKALLALDWYQLLKAGSSPYARALIDDIAGLLAVDDEIDRRCGSPREFAPTHPKTAPPNRLLRNL